MKALKDIFKNDGNMDEQAQRMLKEMMSKEIMTKLTNKADNRDMNFMKTLKEFMSDDGSKNKAPETPKKKKKAQQPPL
ncbi:MAG: hypothetical protein QG635_2379 [Bacteroidota bacterium]|nr:hypothetical protein [Bacteroidota bacterium]